jgi:hypothetical protein
MQALHALATASISANLDRELSFAMGRPDTLGADAYHNQMFPTVGFAGGEVTSPAEAEGLEPPYCAIVKAMVDFSRIIRSICLGIYLPEHECTLAKRIATAEKIEGDLEAWTGSLPENIRPSRNLVQRPQGLRNAKEPNWVKRQRLVLTIRKTLSAFSMLATTTKSNRVPPQASST